MDLVVLAVMTLLSGLLVGALGRFALHGPDPMSLAQTVGIGLAGALIGGAIGAVVWGAGEPGFTLPIQVACATAIVYAIRQRRRRRAEAGSFR